MYMYVYLRSEGERERERREGEREGRGGREGVLYENEMLILKTRCDETKCRNCVTV